MGIKKKRNKHPNHSRVDDHDRGGAGFKGSIHRFADLAYWHGWRRSRIRGGEEPQEERDSGVRSWHGRWHGMVAAA